MTVPPSGIASRALNTRLSSASSNCVESARSGGRPGSMWAVRRTLPPTARPIRSSQRSTKSCRSMGCGFSGWVRPKASIWRTSVAALSSARVLASITRRPVSSLTRRSSTCRPVLMVCRKLFRSCARPPVSRPMASCFWASSSRVWASWVWRMASATRDSSTSVERAERRPAACSAAPTWSASDSPVRSGAGTRSRPSSAAASLRASTGPPIWRAKYRASSRPMAARMPAARNAWIVTRMAGLSSAECGRPTATVQP